ncbi:MAG: ComF family protein, partial [Pseudomonas sp.]
MHCQLENKHEVYIWLKSNQTCLVCDESSGTADPVCSACETELPWLMEHCEVCALPLPATGLVCGQCLKQPAAFKQVVAPWTYSFPVDSLISRFKHQARWPLGHLLAHLLGQFLQHRYEDAALARPDCLLPVPLARKRLRERGFNQAAMLARWLSEDLNIPWDEHLLSRSRETVAQQDLDARTRKRNLHQA